jgi:hypothetical protein
VGCHLGWHLLTSVRGNRGENYENEPLVRQKYIKKKKAIFLMGLSPPSYKVFFYSMSLCFDILVPSCLTPKTLEFAKNLKRAGKISLFLLVETFPRTLL